MNKKRIIVLAGGKSGEYDVSISSANQVISNLDSTKYEAKLVKISKELGDISFIDEIRDFKPEVIFVAMHGSYGEDGKLQGLLEFMNIPYVGSGVLASALGMDKYIFKKYISTFNILMPKWALVENIEELNSKVIEFGLPCVVKPVDGGSSIGVTILRDKEQINKSFEVALQGNKSVLVEEYIHGTEVSCGVLGNDENLVLPVIEIVPKHEFFDYDSKYVDGMSEEIVPARIDDDVRQKIQEESLKVYKAVGARDFARVDFLIRDNVAYLLEINTIPGLTPQSLLPKEAKAAGISYPELLDRLVNMAVLRGN